MRKSLTLLHTKRELYRPKDHKDAQPRPPREGGGPVLSAFLSIAQPVSHSSMIVNLPAWLSEAMLIPYVHATEAFPCLSRYLAWRSAHCFHSWLALNASLGGSRLQRGSV